jgi:hypothetical protein
MAQYRLSSSRDAAKSILPLGGARSKRYKKGHLDYNAFVFDVWDGRVRRSVACALLGRDSKAWKGNCIGMGEFPGRYSRDRAAG